ncbi:hypothetical protein BJX63DRAFT_435029 [Aspergillus granulosus]|uniref:F-box domain-containing protein n=1 Tax=Aspergillus granulosus TaxID=176169 RepID=A0ABR4H344_9EURO
MALLLLPAELLLQILENLGTIEDVLDLMATCSALHALLQNEKISYSDISDNLWSPGTITLYQPRLSSPATRLSPSELWVLGPCDNYIATSDYSPYDEGDIPQLMIRPLHLFASNETFTPSSFQVSLVAFLD